MTRVYDFAAKLSGSLALVCAILAVLATPSSARADDLTNCQNCCAQTYTWGSIEWNSCVSTCMQGAGSCAAANRCDGDDACSNGCISEDVKDCGIAKGQCNKGGVTACGACTCQPNWPSRK